MLNLVFRYYHTLRHLRFTQIRYQLYYLIRRKLNRIPTIKDSDIGLSKDLRSLSLVKSIPAYARYNQAEGFSILNKQQYFSEEIDWNFSDFGKLWTYNLNYFEYLQQDDLSLETGLRLIKNYIDKTPVLKDGLEPFPLSLRLINWIKFIVKHEIDDAEIKRALYNQSELLTGQLEYHLLGNHLLENGFALLFSAYFFQNQSFFKLAEDIITTELREQILPDGSHFELSPMYHQLMLFRLLDVINLIRNNKSIFETKHEEEWETRAGKMLAWLQEISFADGSVPHFNDSTDEIAPTTKQLVVYAELLGISPYKGIKKPDNHFIKNTTHYELRIDTGEIGASYIPGHAHSDSLHFILQVKNQAFIVDTGISTYEKNQRRQYERSTAAHNTVQVGAKEQSDVWGGFRVGRRAKTRKQREEETTLKVSHDGYRNIGVSHERTFVFTPSTISINDQLSQNTKGTARLHFHPSVRVSLNDRTISSSFGKITFSGAEGVELKEYSYALGFNRLAKAQVVEAFFRSELQTLIEVCL